MKRSLIERKQLHFRCRRVNDMMCVIALFGLILMIIDTELRFNQISKANMIIIRPLITISSVILIGLVVYYHLLDIRLYAINNQIADWRVALRIHGVMTIISEVIICAIHPFPYIFKFSSFTNIVWLEMMLTLPSVSVLTAFFGVFASAVLIAVFISKISLNRSEQMVLDFVDRINQARKYKMKTIQIIQYSFRAWFLKRRDPQYRATFNSLYRLHTAIRQARTIKQQQRNAANANESLMTVLTNVYYEQKTNEKNLLKLKQHCDLIEDRMNRLETKLDTLLNIFTRNIPATQHSWL
ncbi:unnamed protein product [Rotaria sp. Silwood1]|nr:unnamed protein product [Rotaria sp. Silwood1]